MIQVSDTQRFVKVGKYPQNRVTHRNWGFNSRKSKESNIDFSQIQILPKPISWLCTASAWNAEQCRYQWTTRIWYLLPWRKLINTGTVLVPTAHFCHSRPSWAAQAPGWQICGSTREATFRSEHSPSIYVLHPNNPNVFPLLGTPSCPWHAQPCLSAFQILGRFITYVSYCLLTFFL